MAIIEQFLYGYHASLQQSGRAVLAHSPGLTKECAAELIRLCEGWGGIPVGHRFRPVLMSFPLQSRMPALPGRLFAVVRITAVLADGQPLEQMSVGELIELETERGGPGAATPIPLFHAAVVNEADFAVFGENPYALALENVFLDSWTPGRKLTRREIHPTSLAPLVSPLPSEGDVELMDEALRQYFNKGKLVLPLGTHDDHSDRFMALLVAALPLRFKRELRFASFAVSDANGYTLAAVYREGQSSRNWQRMLMSHLTGSLSEEAERYLADVKATLGRSDLQGLERLSRQKLGDLRKPAEKKPAARSPGVLSATITKRTQPSPAAWKGSAPVARPPQAARAPQTARPPHAARPPRPPRPPQVKPARGSASPRRRPGRRRPARLRGTGRPSSAFLVAVALVLLLAGAAYLLGTRGGEWFAERESEESEVAGASLLGVIDVGALYEAELAGCVKAQEREDERAVRKATARALSSFRIGAGGELGQQANLFVDLARQGIQLPDRPRREAQRLQALAQRGIVLEQEMRRLLLAYYAMDSGLLWRDLGELSERGLKARYDSLARKQPEALARIAEEMALGNAVPALTAARVEVSGMAELVALFSRPERNRTWTEEAERAAQSLSGHRLSGGAAAYRTSAFLLVRLKRAEAAAGLAGLAFAPDYEQQAWLPATIREVVPAMRDHVARRGRAMVPPLFTAVLDFYTALLRAPAVLESGSVEAMSRLIRNLAESRAYAFDPEPYRDHLDRLRAAAVAVLQRRGENPYDLPSHFFPDGNRDATLAFLQLCRSGAAVEEWREVAGLLDVPFLARWARAQADAADRARRRMEETFDRTYADLARTARQLAGLAAAGQDWSVPHAALVGGARNASEEFRSRLAGDAERRSRLAYLESLVAALAQPLTVDLRGATVRLPATALAEPAEVILELLGGDGRMLLRTPPFTVGPAAPAGTGWVGTLDLEQSLLVLAGQRLRAVVHRTGDDAELLAVVYGDADETAVPGGLARPCFAGAEEDEPPAGVQGSVTFRVGEDTWRRLDVPLPAAD